MGDTASRNILRMVSELHVRGYQRIRIAPGMAPSGCYWRCAVTPASNVGPRAFLTDANWLTATYSSGQGRHYFSWRDAARATPSQLANLFIERFPAIAAEGRGTDWAYAGWYLEMLHLTYPNQLPIAYADWDLPTDCLATTSGSVEIPWPPEPATIVQQVRRDP